jgi:hypothetical protein
MDGRMKDPLSETLERALRVDPSPEFLARARERIRTGPAHRSWAPWSVGFASAAVTAVLAIVVWIAAGRFEPKTATEVVTPVLGSRQIAPSVVESLVETRDTGLTRPAAPARTEQTTPTVLIPRGELAAFRRWISSARSGSFAFANVPEAVPVNQEVSVPEITLMPIGLSDSLE